MTNQSDTNKVPLSEKVYSSCCPNRNHGNRRSRWLIVGGGGYVGWNIAEELGNVQGESVSMVDITLGQSPMRAGTVLPENAVFYKADIRDKVAMFDAFKNFMPDVVLHICSYGMSGMEQLNKKLIEEINIDGLKNCLAACVEFNVQRFVYLSSDTVVLGSDEIHGGSEDTPRVPLYKHCSHYALTKSVAEEIVLASNEKASRDLTTRLRTCVLRSGGIYGVGELRHAPRLVSYLERGLLCFVPGMQPATQDFINIRNLVQALIFAADALTPERDSIACGKVYCISDGCPIGTMEMFAPFITGLGYSVPKIRVPAFILFFLASFSELLVNVLPISFGIKPFLTRQETLKSCTVHYFSIDRARRELGYSPNGPPNDMKAVADDYIQKGYRRPVAGKHATMVKYAVIAVAFAILLSTIIQFINDA